MSDPREDLLGYLLDDLEASERAQVETALATNAQLQAELTRLRQCLSRLQSARRSYDPPAGLAERTCQWIAVHAVSIQNSVPLLAQPDSVGPDRLVLTDTVHTADTVQTTEPEDSHKDSALALPNSPHTWEHSSSACRESGRPVARSKSLAHTAVDSQRPRFLDDPQRLGSWPSPWRWYELVVASAVAGVLLLVLFSAIHQSRLQHEITQCQENLRQLGTAMIQYSELRRGLFPSTTTDGPLAVAGLCGPILLTEGFVQDQRVFWCPGAIRQGSSPVPIPTLAQLERSRPEERVRMISRLGGDYGYSLGYIEAGQYCPARNRHRAYFPILADAPNAEHPERQSPHHGGVGQNVCFEDGHVQFVRDCRLPHLQDHFFLNAQGRMAPGIGPEDSVLAPSYVHSTPPTPFQPVQ